MSPHQNSLGQFGAQWKEDSGLQVQVQKISVNWIQTRHGHSTLTLLSITSSTHRFPRHLQVNLGSRGEPGLDFLGFMLVMQLDVVAVSLHVRCEHIIESCKWICAQVCYTIYVYIYKYAHTHIYLYIYTFTYPYTYTYTYAYTYTYTQTYTHTHKYIHTYIHTYVRTYVHTYTTQHYITLHLHLHYTYITFTSHLHLHYIYITLHYIHTYYVHVYIYVCKYIANVYT